MTDGLGWLRRIHFYAVLRLIHVKVLVNWVKNWDNKGDKFSETW